MTSQNDNVFEKATKELEREKGLYELLAYYVEHKGENKDDAPSAKYTVGICDYLECYDTGIVFDSLTDVAQLKTLRKEFCNAFKDNITRMCSAPFFKQIMPSLSAKVFISDDKDDFISVNLYNDGFGLLPKIRVNKNGLIYTGFDFINFYSDVKYNPYSLYLKSEKNKFDSVDDLPITVKMLERTIKDFLAHVRFDKDFTTCSLDDSKLYGGLSSKNIISKYVKYLIDKFKSYCAQGRADGFEIFPKETEDKLNEYESWFLYGAGRQRFSNLTEDGFVEEKRPSDFIRDLQDVISTKSHLTASSAKIEEYLNNQRAYLKEALEILSPLFADDNEVMSVTDSFNDFMSIVDDFGYDPLEKIACVLEGFCDINSFLGLGLEVARAVYCCADKAKEQLQKKNKRFYAREATNEKGLGIENFAIVVHEATRDGKVSLCKRLKIVDEEIERRSFSLLRVSNGTYAQLKEVSLEPCTQTVVKDGNIYVHAYNENSEREEWSEEFFELFKQSSFLKAVDSSFEDLSFDLTNLVKTEILVQNMMAEQSRFISACSEETLGVNLELEYDGVLRRLELKKKLKEEEINNRKNKYDMIFNFAFAVFGAFGVASSIVSILISDTVSKAISVCSIVMYLFVVLISYKNSKK